MKMKLISASVALTAVLSATSLAAAQDGGEQTCVVGAFALEFDGACTAEAIVAAYADQVFDAPGARSPTCAADAETDLNAKLDAAGLSGAAALCDQVYAAQDRVPFTDAAKRGTDLHFERMFYNGRTDWQEEVETLYETEDQTPTSVLEDDAVQVRTFYRGIAQGRRVEWPGALSNFRSSVTDADDLATCTTNAAMCCWPKDRQAGDNNGNCATPYDEECVDKDPADNTDLCFVDPRRGNNSTGFDSTDGVLVYPDDNNDGEGSVHCHGVAWSNDVNHHSARYKANNLFFVSMYDHMYQRGYVQNIPGAPMCGCVEQMPTVSRSDCTQIDITETIKITFDPEAVTPFQSELTHIDVDFNACQGIDNRNNDLWAYIARLYYDGHVTSKQYGEAGRIITDNGCDEAIKFHLNSLGMSTGYDIDVSTWTKVAGRDAMFPGHPHGTTAFNTVLENSVTPDYPIIFRICPGCIKTHQKVYYRRLTVAPDEFDILDNILRYSGNDAEAGNTWNEDFTLHSTYDDAQSGANPWACHEDKFNYQNAFVGECSPSGDKEHDQHSYWWSTSGPQQDVAFFINAPDGAGIDVADLASLANLGPQYTNTDLGRPEHAGRVFQRTADDAINDAIIVTGAGNDIWGQRDMFHYLSQPWTGDVDVQVHVTAFTGIHHSWAKTGIMFRSDNGASAAHAFGMLSGSEGVTLGTRRSQGGHSQTMNGNYQTDPRQKSSWLRLVKTGITVIFYYRDNEADEWIEHVSDTVRFPDDTYRVGLAVTSHDNAHVSEAVFEDYKVEELAFPTLAPTATAAPTSWDPIVYVGGAREGSLTKDATNGISYYQAYGTGIWGTRDSFLFNNVQKATADGAFDVVAYSERFHTSYGYAKAGIMIRDDNDAGAAHAFLGVSGYYLGVTFQTRAAAGETTVNHYTHYVSSHRAWMKLSKPADSNVITSFYKVDVGDPWIEIGSMEIELTGGLMTVGTAITSGDSSGNGRVDYEEMGFEIVDGPARRKALRA